MCVSFLYKNKVDFKQLVFNEKKSREKKSYKPYTKIISEKIKSIVKEAIGNAPANDAVGIDPDMVYTSPEQNLGYRDATLLINHLMATGELHGKKDKLGMLTKYLKEASDIRKTVDDHTNAFLTKDPPIKKLCKIRCNEFKGDMKEFFSCAIF